MLRVPTRLGVSPIHGIGLFAAAPIAAGTVIWEYDPHFDLSFTEEHLARLGEPARMQVDKYSYFDSSVGAFVLCGDDGRFMNHSSTPNTAEVDGLTLAARDIPAGEELTCDYGELGVSPHEYAAYEREADTVRP
jgi:SET domain-containing protein